MSYNQKKYLTLGDNARPRVSIFKSLNHFYVQAIDDVLGRTIESISTLSKKILIITIDKHFIYNLGKMFGIMLLKRGIFRVIFDRNKYKYSGKIAQLADGIRKVGIIF